MVFFITLPVIITGVFGDILEDFFLDSSKLNILAGGFNINWRDINNSDHLKRQVTFFN